MVSWDALEPRMPLNCRRPSNGLKATRSNPKPEHEGKARGCVDSGTAHQAFLDTQCSLPFSKLGKRTRPHQHSLDTPQTPPKALAPSPIPLGQETAEEMLPMLFRGQTPPGTDTTQEIRSRVCTRHEITLSPPQPEQPAEAKSPSLSHQDPVP